MGKIGEGHLAAFGRQGLRELRGMLYTGSNVAQQPEYGLYGTLTPGEVAEARRDSAMTLEQEGPRQESVLADYQQRSQARPPPDREPPEPELDR